MANRKHAPSIRERLGSITIAHLILDEYRYLLFHFRLKKLLKNKSFLRLAKVSQLPLNAKIKKIKKRSKVIKKAKEKVVVSCIRII